MHENGRPRVPRHMRMIEPSTPDAFSPKLAPLTPVGWTVTASDEAPSYLAGNVLDGNSATIWHSLSARCRGRCRTASRSI